MQIKQVRRCTGQQLIKKGKHEFERTQRESYMGGSLEGGKRNDKGCNYIITLRKEVIKKPNILCICIILVYMMNNAMLSQDASCKKKMRRT